MELGFIRWPVLSTAPTQRPLPPSPEGAVVGPSPWKEALCREHPS